MRINGGKHKNDSELQLDLNDDLTLKYLVRQSIKKFGAGSEKHAKLYNKQGVELFDEDFNLVAPNDILYVALNGENFNYCAILDDYEMGRVLGVGGFGKVIHAKHKENKKQVAIKFTDVKNELSSANQMSAVFKEAESLKSLIHKHIVQLFHAFIEGNQFIMIMEAAMGGELLGYTQKKQTIDEKIARSISM